MRSMVIGHSKDFSSALVMRERRSASSSDPWLPLSPRSIDCSAMGSLLGDGDSGNDGGGGEGGGKIEE